MLRYKGSKIQVLDLPGIIEGAAHGAGRGKEVIAVARSADAILIVLDAGKEGLQRHREILERELETVGIRLNQKPPDVTVTKRKSGGGVRFASTVPQPHLGPEPEKLVTQILREYRMTAADVRMETTAQFNNLHTITRCWPARRSLLISWWTSFRVIASTSRVCTSTTRLIW